MRQRAKNRPRKQHDRGDTAPVVRPATNIDIAGLLACIEDQLCATLTMQIAGMPTRFSYDGMVIRDEAAHGLHGLTFVPFDWLSYPQPPSDPYFSIELHLDQIEGLSIKEYPNGIPALCWSSTSGSVELTVVDKDYDGD